MMLIQAGLSPETRDRLLAAGDIGLKLVLTLLLVLTLRRLAVRAISASVRPLILRAEKEGSTSVSRIRTLEGLARSAASYSLLIVAAVTVLAIFDISVLPLLTGAGIVGLALGIGAQRLVRDLFTGFFLLLEDQFRVGEMVTLVGAGGIPQMTGTILEMGLRVTRMRDQSGKLVTIGNGDIAAVVNHSRDAVLAIVELGVPSDVPLESVREAVAGLVLPAEVFAGPAEVQGVAAVEKERVAVRFVAPSRPGQAVEAELALRQAVRECLHRAGITVC